MNIGKWIKDKTVGVLYGGLSAEREISLLSGKAVLAALKNIGVNAVGIDASPRLPFELSRKKIDFAYIALHGPGGEDGTVQGLLESMQIPYSGCGVFSSALCMDKAYTKKILESADLPTPAWQRLVKPVDEIRVGRLPVVIKPATQGSAIGVSIVRTEKEVAPALKKAFALDTVVLAEEYVIGTEITVGILGKKALPVIEIDAEGEFYDFKSKYTPGCSRHIIPPRLPERVVANAQMLALEAFNALGCRGVARVDMIVDKKLHPWILELNTLPGMTETSLLPDAARAARISFSDLILQIIKHSL
ncbi:MAG: hypothetical protein A2219_07520 [Elusimicrobia bacterium RIFOXYA2_FULL_50_26]|nr:MAG: hypothetical protein A2219_07520 [Elusimicrobia bacterium RIFOXYA2_FULL_50_26]